MSQFAFPRWLKRLIIAAGVVIVGYWLIQIAMLLFFVFLFGSIFSGINNDDEVIFANYEITSTHHWYLIFRDARGQQLLADPTLIARYKNDIRTQYRTSEDGLFASISKRDKSKFGAALYQDGEVVRSSWVTNPNRVTYGNGLRRAFPVLRCTVSGDRTSLRIPFAKGGPAWSWIYPAGKITDQINHDVISITFSTATLGIIENREEDPAKSDEAAKAFDQNRIKQSLQAALASALNGEADAIEVNVSFERSQLQTVGGNWVSDDIRLLFRTAQARILVPPDRGTAIAARLAQNPALSAIYEAPVSTDQLSQFLRKLERSRLAPEQNYRPALPVNLTGRTLFSVSDIMEETSIPFFVRPEDQARTSTWPNIQCSSTPLE